MGKFTLIAESALPLEIEFAGRLRRGGGGGVLFCCRGGGGSLLLSNVAALPPVVLLCHDEGQRRGVQGWRLTFSMSL